MLLPEPEVQRAGTVHWTPPAAPEAAGAARSAAGARLRSEATRAVVERTDMGELLLAGG
jgi:hypothetical protein